MTQTWTEERNRERISDRDQRTGVEQQGQRDNDRNTRTDIGEGTSEGLKTS